jgi:hypothetical protein
MYTADTQRAAGVSAAQPQKQFDGTMFNMMGSPYAMMEADAMTYGKAYRVRPPRTLLRSALSRSTVCLKGVRTLPALPHASPVK